MVKVQRIPRAGHVGIETSIGLQSVVAGIVDAAERQSRPEMVALTTVVVDDVEDHFDPGIVQSFNGSLETGNRLSGQKARVRGKIADRVVAPVIGETTLDEMAIVDRSLDRHQLDRGDPEIDEIID